MTLLEQIQKAKLTKTEQSVTDYIRKHPKEVTDLTIEELARKTYSSKTTVTRVCKKLGLRGFPEMKVRIAEELSSFELDEQEVMHDIPISYGQDRAEIAHSIMNLQYQSLMQIYHSLNLDTLYHAAQLIDASDLVLLYGRGESLLALKSLQSDLTRIGKRSYAEMTLGFEPVHRMNEKTKCCAVVLSQFMNTQIIRHTLNELYDYGIPVILIHGRPDDPLTKRAQYSISFENRESHAKTGSFASRVIKHYILDVLYSLVFALHYDQNVREVKKHAEAVKRKDQIT